MPPPVVPAANQKIVSFQLTLAAAAQRLSNGYGGASSGNAIDPVQDVPLREVHIYAEAQPLYIGKDANVASSSFGDTCTATNRIIIGPYNNGGIKLSDVWIAGAGATAHVFGVVF